MMFMEHARQRYLQSDRTFGCAKVSSALSERNSKNLRIPQGDAELINECPHRPDIQKQNNDSALMNTIVGIEVL